MDYKTLTEALAVFATYQPDNLRIDTRWGCIYAGPEPYEVSEADMMLLEQLGWIADYTYDCFALQFDDTILPSSTDDASDA